MNAFDAQDLRNIEIVRKLTAHGHQIEVNIRHVDMGCFRVGLNIWHRNDTQRYEQTYAWLANFKTKAGAQAYFPIIKAAAGEGA